MNDAPTEVPSDWLAICVLKARYCRLLDTKSWQEWGQLFTEDFVLDTSAAGGPPPVTGRDRAVAMVREGIEAARTAHHVHQPEISIDGGTAAGIWAMQDRLVFPDGTTITGHGHYHETYARQDGRWRIASLTLTRLLLDVIPPPAGAVPGA